MYITIQNNHAIALMLMIGGNQYITKLKKKIIGKRSEKAFRKQRF
jgi:hypothetical protein